MKNFTHNKLWKYGVVTSVGLLILFFNNCKGSSEEVMELQSATPTSTSGSPSPGSSSSNTVVAPTSPTGATGTLCEQDIKNLYSRGWQKFLVTNCQTCHAEGPGKGRFANSDVNIAYSEFELVGYVKVSNNAVNASHNAPYSGLQHTQTVNDLKLEWQRGLQDYASCTGTSTQVKQETQVEKITLLSTEQTVDIANDGDKKELTWTISSDLARIKGAAPSPDIPGGKFSITVTRLKNGGGFTYYTFSSPKVYGASVDARIQGIFININGILLNYPTTFSYVDKSVRKGNINDLSAIVSTGSLVTPKVVLPTDKVSISFIDITAVSLPPPPPPMTVNLVGTKTVIVPKGTGFIDLQLALSSPAVEPVVVTLSEDTDLCGTASTLANSNTLFKTVSATCLPDVYNAVCPGGACVADAKMFGRARSDVGVTYKRYDWDYKFPTGTVTFGAGESSKTLRVYFSKDIRYEKNRVLSLNIASSLGSAVIGTNKTVNYIINKYNNPVPNGSILTYSELMAPNSGILGQNCTACHNSTDFAGNYNVTDYELMIANKVLIPGDLNSKMFLRMHPTPEFLGKPMPLNGFLTQDKILEVELWIKAGAPNN